MGELSMITVGFLAVGQPLVPPVSVQPRISPVDRFTSEQEPKINQLPQISSTTAAIKPEFSKSTWSQQATNKDQLHPKAQTNKSSTITVLSSTEKSIDMHKLPINKPRRQLYSKPNSTFAKSISVAENLYIEKVLVQYY